jgi:hypothetical protein
MIKSLYFTVGIRVFCMILVVKSTTSVYSIHQLLYIKETQHVLCEVHLILSFIYNVDSMRSSMS